jgi:hypothetical protein
MKIYLFPIVIGGFIVTFVLQAFMYSSVGLQSQMLQTRLEEINKKLDKLQTDIDISSSLVGARRDSPESATKSTSTIETNTSDILVDPSDPLSAENLQKTLEATATTGDNITLKASWNTVDVFETTKASSRIVGKISSGKTYKIAQRGNGWYKINLDANTAAWVQAQFVYETI